MKAICSIKCKDCLYPHKNEMCKIFVPDCTNCAFEKRQFDACKTGCLIVLMEKQERIVKGRK